MGTVRSWKQPAKSWLMFAAAALISIPSLFVFYWMLIVSLKSDVDSQAYPPAFLFFEPSFKSYGDVLTETPFVKYLINTLIVSLGTVFAGLVLGLPAAYGIARWKLHAWSVGIVATRMIPGISFLLPWYLLFREFGLIDTYFGLIIAQLTICLPMVIWLMIGFFEEVPAELHDAARIDGCTEFGSFVRIILPLTRQGIAASSILSFIYAWNNFMFPIILAGQKTRTLPAAVFSAMSFEQINWANLAAMATLVTLPVLVLFGIAQKHIVAGLTSGGVKG
jgi:multiple sugar transport system permease protein